MIAKVEVVRTRRAGWPGYKVREITAGGRVLHSYECHSLTEARTYARRIARQHGAELILPTLGA